MPPPERTARSGLFPSLATRCALVLMAALPTYAQAAATPSYPPRATATPIIVPTAKRTPFTPMKGSALHAGMKAHNAARKDRDRDSDSDSDSDADRVYRSGSSGLSSGASGSGEKRGAKRETNSYCRNLSNRLSSNTERARSATTIHSRDKIENERRAIRKSQSEQGCSRF